MKYIMKYIRSWKRKTVLFWAGLACCAGAVLVVLGAPSDAISESLQGLMLAVIAASLFKACEVSDSV